MLLTFTYTHTHIYIYIHIYIHIGLNDKSHWMIVKWQYHIKYGTYIYIHIGFNDKSHWMIVKWQYHIKHGTYIYIYWERWSYNNRISPRKKYLIPKCYAIQLIYSRPSIFRTNQSPRVCLVIDVPFGGLPHTGGTQGNYRCKARQV